MQFIFSLDEFKNVRTVPEIVRSWPVCFMETDDYGISVVKKSC